MDGPSRRPLNTALLALFAAGASMFMTSGPLWMTVAGMVAGVAGIFFAVVALVRLRLAERRAVIVFSALVAMAVAGFGLVTGGVRLAFWDTVSTYERCMTDSVTISGQAGCQQDMENNLEGILLPGLE
ncbi:hypothetical protein EDL96_11605 [Kocuria soli]|uniref:DUF4190 domain-containing protein n=1 Tax=Kocuria soli TaxID=2485125 RepID=A0A3N3ZMJ3_9MICC|nr:hypothetical protein EDL96_11605 [Kocuria soli]